MPPKSRRAFAQATAMKHVPTHVGSGRRLTRSVGAALASLACALLAGGCVSGGSSAASEPIDTEVQLASFDEVWRTVKEQHYDPETVGESWDRARETYRPRVAAAETKAEVRSVINDMLGTLGQSHFGVIPAESYEALEEDDDGGGSGGGDGQTGLRVRLMDIDGSRRAVVVRVREGSTGHEAGVEPGWVLVEIDGKPVADLIDRLAGIESGPARLETMAALNIQRRLSGRVGSELELVALDGADERRELSLPRGEAPGELATFGNLPPMPVVIDTQSLDQGVGYFAFNIFLNPPRVIGAVRRATSAAQDAPGFVLDLRGNLGGIAGMTNGIAGFFTDRRGLSLGEMKTRTSTIRLPVNPRRGAYLGPVAVLVDEASISSAEIMPAGMQQLGLARVFGVRTAGLALPSNVSRLPNGDGLQYVFASIVGPNGEPVEGEGVIPDTIVETTREDLVAGRDPVLEAAVAWLLQQGGDRPEPSAAGGSEAEVGAATRSRVGVDVPVAAP